MKPKPLLSIEISSLVRTKEDRFTLWSVFTLFGLCLCKLLWLYLVNLRDSLLPVFKEYSSWSLGHSSGGVVCELVGTPVVGEAWGTLVVGAWSMGMEVEGGEWVSWGVGEAVCVCMVWEECGGVVVGELQLVYSNWMAPWARLHKSWWQHKILSKI